jgi:AcrR family transcriptional regulator
VIDSISATEADPRRVRSRARLIDAATALLLSGGVSAVTMDAVARTSKVARTTLYRHFKNSDALLAAAFAKLLPEVSSLAADGNLREQLTDLLNRQAALIERAPTQLTALAWLSVIQRSTDSQQDTEPLRDRIVSQYRRAFDQLLTSDTAKAELGDIDLDMAIAQLIGPLVFAQLAGLDIGTNRCPRLVQDFFASHSPAGSTL